MTRVTFPMAILAAFALGFLGLQLTSTAQAQAQAQAARTTTCVIFGKIGGQGDLEKWMNDQLLAGRAEFITVGGLLCAY